MDVFLAGVERKRSEWRTLRCAMRTMRWMPCRMPCCNWSALRHNAQPRSGGAILSIWRTASGHAASPQRSRRLLSWCLEFRGSRGRTIRSPRHRIRPGPQASCTPRSRAAMRQRWRSFRPAARAFLLRNLEGLDVAARGCDGCSEGCEDTLFQGAAVAAASLENSDMTGESAETEFERRTRALLQAGVEELSGHVRSRLTQARHAALDQGRAARRVPSWQRWLPAVPLLRSCCWRCCSAAGTGAPAPMAVARSQSD